jgi:hypothetical protein
VEDSGESECGDVAAGGFGVAAARGCLE